MSRPERMVGPAGEHYIWNGRDRLATVEACAFALYEGAIRDTGVAGEFEWSGTHVGAVGTAEEAEAWVRGEEVQGVMRIYPPNGQPSSPVRTQEPTTGARMGSAPPEPGNQA